MKRICAALVCGTILLGGGLAIGHTKKGEKINGKKEFEEHCAVCHKGGGNIINPQKTLHRADREANGVKSVKDITKLVRNPGPGMTRFDKKTLSDKEARAVAEYIIKTF